MSDPITDAELAEIRALADRATPGPWVQGFVIGRCHMEHRHDGKACVYDYTITRDSEAECQHVSIAPNVTLIGSDDNGSILSTPDAAFIAASRSFVPRLLDLIAHQRAALRGKTFSGESPVVVEAERDELRREVERLRGAVCCAGEPHTCDQEAIAAAEGKTDRVIIERNGLFAEVSRLKAGRCSDIIPSTFVACGEGGNFCSEACRLKAGLREMREWCTEHIEHYVADHSSVCNVVRDIDALIGKEPAILNHDAEQAETGGEG